MVTIRVDKKFWTDPRLTVMAEKIPRVTCYGAVLSLWQIGQEHWRRGELIPEKVFDKLPYSAHLLRAKFVEKREDGVYCLGARDRWKYLNASHLSKAGKASAEARRKKYGSSQPTLSCATQKNAQRNDEDRASAEQSVRTECSRASEQSVRDAAPLRRTECSNSLFDSAERKNAESEPVFILENGSIETLNTSSNKDLSKNTDPGSNLELDSKSSFLHQIQHNSKSSKPDFENLNPEETPPLFPSLDGPKPKPKKIKTDRKQPDQSAGLFVARYCEVYKARWKANPIVIGRYAGAAKRIVQAIGVAKAITLVEIYLTMNDRWFLQKKHDLITFEQNLNAVAIKAGTGQEMTSTEAAAIDRKQANLNAFKEIAAELRARGET